MPVASRASASTSRATGNDAVAILSRVTGRPFTYYQIPLDVIRRRMGEDTAKMYKWLDRVGITVDRTALHREFLDVPFHAMQTLSRFRLLFYPKCFASRKIGRHSAEYRVISTDTILLSGVLNSGFCNISLVIL